MNAVLLLGRASNRYNTQAQEFCRNHMGVEPILTLLQLLGCLW